MGSSCQSSLLRIGQTGARHVQHGLEFRWAEGFGFELTDARQIFEFTRAHGLLHSIRGSTGCDKTRLMNESGSSRRRSNSSLV